MGLTAIKNSDLERFLRLPEFQPALEFLDGRVIQKMSPMLPHSVIQGELLSALNAFARPRKLGRAYPELRAVFGGEAQVPDVSFYSTERMPKFVRGEETPFLDEPPDISAEILSPGQTFKETERKILHAIQHGTKLGWIFDSAQERIGVVRPGRKIEILKKGDLLSGEDVLPEFSLTVDEIFGWLDQD